MDAQHLSDLFAGLQARLRRSARQLLGNDDDAADALQDVFCALWSRRDSIADERMAEGMAVASVRNRCIDTLRQRSSRRTVGVDEAPAIAVEPSATDADELYSEVDAVIRRSLGERDRQILILREQSGWEIDEIAIKFNMTPAAVRMALSRARRTVLQAYKARYHD